MSFETVVRVASGLMEGAGALAMLGGAGVAIALAGRTAARRDGAAAFRELRQRLGRAILLGLEFLVAADILETLGHLPSLREVGVLGGIVLIRTFLSFTLEAELEGRWPWQRAAAEAHERGPLPAREAPRDPAPAARAGPREGVEARH